MHPGKVDKAQTIVEGLFHLLLHFLAQAVPFVDDDHQGAAAVEDKAQQRQILIGDAFAGINHQQHDVGVFNRLQRLDDREFLHHVSNFAALAHPGGIDEHVFALVTLHRDVNAVAGGARHIVDHHTIFAEDAVGERRFTDVRTSDNRQLDRQILRIEIVFRLFFRFTILLSFEFCPVFGVFIHFFLRINLIDPWQQGLLKQAGHAAAVRSGNRIDIAQAERPEVRHRLVDVDAVGFVSHQEGGLFTRAQVFSDRDVRRHQARARIDHKQHHIGLFDCQQRLLRHPGFHALFRTINTTGIDTDEFAAFDFGPTVLTVTSQPREIRNQRITSARQAVKERGFSNVRAPDKRDHRYHVKCLIQSLSNIVITTFLKKSKRPLSARGRFLITHDSGN
ncbi:hypothetical protein SB00098_01319 [Klebsiella quasipneumoniae subsp. quasipneumoniae]|nr:hypothetical protein SB00098_01319 [Klebsiella quasipneumoniae subsp. quasipneumoniae]